MPKINIVHLVDRVEHEPLHQKYNSLQFEKDAIQKAKRTMIKLSACPKTFLYEKQGLNKARGQGSLQPAQSKSFSEMGSIFLF